MQLDDIALSYYQHNDAGALWLGLPIQATTNTPTWQWMPHKRIALPNDADTIDSLIARDWRAVAGNEWSFLRYNGQLANVVTLDGTEQAWVSSADERRFNSTPVTLAFTRTDLPDDDYRDALKVQAQGVALLQIEQMLPPPQFGELALVDDTVDGVPVLRIHNVTELGEAGTSIQQKLGQALQDLAAPGAWWPIPNFERRMSERPRATKDSRTLAIPLLKTIGQRTEWLNIEQVHADSDPDAWLARWQAIQSLAHDLVYLYWQVHCTNPPRQVPRSASALTPTEPAVVAPGVSDEPITSASGEAEHTVSGKRKLPEVARVMNDRGYIPIPSAWPIHTFLAAYSGGKTAGGWQEGDEGAIPTYHEKTKAHDTQLAIRDEDERSKPASYDDGTRQKLWATVRELNDLDGDVFLAMLAQYLTVKQDSDKSVWLTGATILDYRGVQPMMKREGGVIRRAGHRQEDLEAIAACVARQERQWVSIKSVIADDGKTKSGKQSKRRPMKVFERTSRLTTIFEVIWQHELLPDANAEMRRANSYAVAWRYRIGTWLEPFLQGSNRQVAYLCQQALRYDPYHESWEKRIARYLVFQLRINKGRQLSREIGKLLEDLHLEINRADPIRTRARLEKALNRLCEDRVLGSWEYGQDNPSLPRREWLTTWLQWKVVLRSASDGIISGVASE